MPLWHIILIQVVTFGIILIFLRLLFYKHLSTALKRLQELNRQNLEKEVALNKELERAKHERAIEIEKGKEEAKTIKDASRKEAESIKERILKEAVGEREKLLEEAVGECSRLKRETVSQMEESGVKLACEVIKEIFSEKARQELNRELVDELIDELRKIDKEKLKVDANKIEVVSTYPLSEAQRNAIKEIIQDRGALAIELEERLDNTIISGLIINLGGRILDGSLANKLRRIIPYLHRTEHS